VRNSSRLTQDRVTPMAFRYDPNTDSLTWAGGGDQAVVGTITYRHRKDNELVPSSFHLPVQCWPCRPPSACPPAWPSRPAPCPPHSSGTVWTHCRLPDCCFHVAIKKKVRRLIICKSFNERNREYITGLVMLNHMHDPHMGDLRLPQGLYPISSDSVTSPVCTGGILHSLV